MLENSPLTHQIAGLAAGIQTEADLRAAEAGAVAALHALILASLAHLLARLADMIGLWQSGLLPRLAPVPRAGGTVVAHSHATTSRTPRTAPMLRPAVGRTRHSAYGECPRPGRAPASTRAPRNRLLGNIHPGRMHPGHPQSEHPHPGPARPAAPRQPGHRFEFPASCRAPQCDNVVSKLRLK